jgi:hypothetical protein
VSTENTTSSTASSTASGSAEADAVAKLSTLDRFLPRPIRDDIDQRVRTLLAELVPATTT